MKGLFVAACLLVSAGGGAAQQPPATASADAAAQGADARARPPHRSPPTRCRSSTSTTTSRAPGTSSGTCPRARLARPARSAAPPPTASSKAPPTRPTPRRKARPDRITVKERIEYQKDAKTITKQVTDSRGFSYRSKATVAGDLGGIYNILFESEPFVVQGKTITLKESLRTMSPFNYRVSTTVSVDGGPFTNFGTPWWRKQATVGSTMTMRRALVAPDGPRSRGDVAQRPRTGRWRLPAGAELADAAGGDVLRAEGRAAATRGTRGAGRRPPRDGRAARGGRSRHRAHQPAGHLGPGHRPAGSDLRLQPRRPSR